MSLLDVLKPKSLDGVVSNIALADELLRSRDFWRMLHASLKEERRVILRHDGDLDPQVASLATMCGFTNLVSK